MGKNIVRKSWIWQMTKKKKKRVGRDSENSSRRVGCIGRDHQGVERRRCVGAVQKDIAKRCKFFAGSGRCSRSACKSIGGTQGVHAATSKQKRKVGIVGPCVGGQEDWVRKGHQDDRRYGSHTQSGAKRRRHKERILCGRVGFGR